MHPGKGLIVGTQPADGCYLQTVRFNSIAVAALKHRLADNMRWEPGMLALPCHDAPWWWTD